MSDPWNSLLQEVATGKVANNSTLPSQQTAPLPATTPTLSKAEAVSGPLLTSSGNVTNTVGDVGGSLSRAAGSLKTRAANTWSWLKSTIPSYVTDIMLMALYTFAVCAVLMLLIRPSFVLYYRTQTKTYHVSIKRIASVSTIMGLVVVGLQVVRMGVMRWVFNSV